MAATTSADALPAPLAFCTAQTVLDHVLLVTINRPAKLNALSAEASAELSRVWDHFEANPELWVAIVTGAGERAFCAGFDLSTDPNKVSKMDTGGATVRTGFGGLAQRETCFKPIIAAVNGVAHGGGFELALACDVILASERASFALPEPKRGLAALAGGLVRLPRVIGVHRAMGMILTGKTATAVEGLQLGWVNEVVPHDKLLPRALEYARMIIDCSPDSIAASKRTVALSLETPSVYRAMDAQNKLPEVRGMLKGDNMREGLAAFMQKRAPRWKSRL